MHIALLVSLAGQSPAVALPSPDSIRVIVTRRVADPRIPGLAVGRISRDGVIRQVGGVRQADGTVPVTSATVFEIGSISKAFTGVLLADMVVKGEVGLDDPVSRYLPPGSRVPEYDGAAITLRQLANHTSGLPRLPDNLAPANPDDPYADYDEARLLAFLAGHTLRRAPGASYEYSNLGGGLLGYALARRAGSSYEALLRARILAPLGMTATGIEETPAMRASLSAGHDIMGLPTQGWHLTALAGAGGIRSTLDDMLRFAAAASDTVHGPLAKAMALAQRPTFRVDSMRSVGLGWHLRTSGGRTVVWHNGGTGGFRSMMAVDPGLGAAGVVLSNAVQDQDPFGFYLLNAVASVPPLPAARATVAVDRAVLARYPGRYILTPAFAITITLRDSTGIDLQATGQPRLRLHATSPTDFFVQGVEASITFEVTPSGEVVALVLHQNGVNQRAPRAP